MFLRVRSEKMKSSVERCQRWREEQMKTEEDSYGCSRGQEGEENSEDIEGMAGNRLIDFVINVPN